MRSRLFNLIAGLACLSVCAGWELTGNGGFGAGVFFALGGILLADAYWRWRDDR